MVVNSPNTSKFLENRGGGALHPFPHIKEVFLVTELGEDNKLGQHFKDRSNGGTSLPPSGATNKIICIYYDFGDLITSVQDYQRHVDQRKEDCQNERGRKIGGAVFSILIA